MRSMISAWLMRAVRCEGSLKAEGVSTTVCRSRFKPMIEKAKMIKNNFDNIITYSRHPISNGAAEALNSRIQSLKSSARGFRSFLNYRTRILFYLGKLDLFPL